MKKCSMQKKIESLKKNEDSARPYMNRLYCLVEQGYLDWATIGEYLTRGLSEDMVEKAYGWMKQDELVPTDDALEEDGFEWDEDGELVAIANANGDINSDESKKRESAPLDNYSKAYIQLNSLEDNKQILNFETNRGNADFTVLIDADKFGGSIPYGDYMVKHLGLDPTTVTVASADVINNAKSYADVNNLAWLRNLIKEGGIDKICRVTLNVNEVGKKSPHLQWVE